MISRGERSDFVPDGPAAMSSGERIANWRIAERAYT